jgi:hypothetical protein
MLWSFGLVFIVTDCVSELKVATDPGGSWMDVEKY